MNAKRGLDAVRRFFRHRQHPIKLLDYSSRNLWLLLIPLSKRLIAMQFHFQEWLRTSWLDILTITVIFAVAILRWLFVSFDIEPDGISAKTGLFGMIRTKVYFTQFTTVSFCQSWYNRPFGANKIYIETNAKSVGRQDIKLVLSQRNSDALYSFVSSLSKEKPRISYSPKKTHLFIFSLLFSSALTGMLLYGTFMYEVSKIVGIEGERAVFERVNGEVTKIDSRFLRLTETIPQVILALAALVIGGWFVSFLATLARHWSFTVGRSDRQFFIKSGVLIKRRHIISRDKINYYDLTQTLLMKLFHICSVTLDCAGYGQSRREISALIPITTYDQMNASLKLLVPELPRPKPEIDTVGANGVRRFVTMPAMLCALPPLAIKLLDSYFPNHNPDLNALIAIVTVPLIWLVIVKTAAAFNTSVGFDDTGAVLNYCKGYQFHKVFLPKKNISMIRIIRNPFQLTNNTCTLVVCTVGLKRKSHVIRFVRYDLVKEMCTREGYSLF
ncbi:putative membrane protein [Ruminococcus sp. YE71]|uniref:PH domain-containing protein n=1 Tax=unclassified Ruminococcus TaxID=2608920 RepID=UPI000889A97C|nr:MULTISPECIES: PH domain-containing protein [unclassified Ruminococcus]SDA15563.1 putative membrane protein [Ruminococcus sp. YE78]SFW22782.1 putative membrane protein [Ruminococcus sp. YE71]